MNRARKIIAAVVLTGSVATASALAAGSSSAAQAAGATVSVSSQTQVMINSHCYHTHHVTVTNYFYSKTHGWTRYAAPRRTVTDSTTCK